MSMWDYKLYIDGAWSDGEEGNSIEVIDPATEGVIGRVAEATPKDAARAIEAARQRVRRGALAVDQAGRASGRPGPDG